jgi:hypothetical protein
MMVTPCHLIRCMAHRQLLFLGHAPRFLHDLLSLEACTRSLHGNQSILPTVAVLIWSLQAASLYLDRLSLQSSKPFTLVHRVMKAD